MKKPISFSNFSEADTHKTQDGKTAKKGLWYNINQRKKKGLSPKKPGSDGYPKTLDIEAKEAVSKDGKKLVIPRTGNPRGIPPKTEGGLWDNIHKRRKAGKAPKKPGDKGYPKTLDIESKEVNEMLPAMVGMAVRKIATKKIGKIGGRVAGAVAAKAAMSKEKEEAYEPITTKRSQALAKADAEPKKPVTLPKAPWDKKKEPIKAHKVAGRKSGPHKEGYVSNAQRAAVWANRADGGKGHPDNKKKSKKEGAMKRMSTGDGMDTYKKKPDEVKSINKGLMKNRNNPQEKDKDVKKINKSLSQMRGEAFSSRAIVKKDRQGSGKPMAGGSDAHKAAVKKYIGGMKSNRPGTPDSKLPRQMRDPKKDAMVSKGGKVKVIDKSKEDDHLKKGYVRAEHMVTKELFMKEAKTMMVTKPGSNEPIQITVDQWPGFKMRGYHHAEQKENRLSTMKLIDKMKKASPAAKAALNAPSRVDGTNVTYNKAGKVVKEAMAEMHCKDCGCQYGDIDPDCDCPNDGSDRQGEHFVAMDEALDMKQRLARGRSARKNKSKLAMGRKKAGRRIASMKVLKKRARRAARKTLTKRLTKGVAKSDLSVSRKREIEKRLDKPAFKIKANRLVKRTIKDIRKKEIARKRK